MNRTYSVIRDRVTGEAMVASELARRRGKQRSLRAFSSALLLAGGGAAGLLAPGQTLATFCGEATDSNDDSLFCGYQAGVWGSDPVSGNTAFGYQALAGQSGVAVGRGALASKRSVNIGNDSRAGGQSTETEGAVGIGASTRTGNMTVSIGYQSNLNLQWWQMNGAVAIGANSVARSNSVAIGSLASSAENSVALGAGSSVTASNSVALGRNSEANIDSVVSIGSGSLKRRLINLADGTSEHHAVTLRQLQGTSNYFKSSSELDATITSSNAVAAGAGAIANGGSSAFGAGAKAFANNGGGGSTAIGYMAEAGWEAVAVGSESKAPARHSTAIGRAAQATVENATAIGWAAKAAANGAVALGHGSIADQGNTVSIGVANGIQRRIVNVAPGTAANDAATFGQLTQTNTNLSNLTNTVNTHTGNINTLTSTTNTHTNQITTLTNNVNTHTNNIAVHNTRIGAVETLVQGTERYFKANANSAGSNHAPASIAAGIEYAVVMGRDAQAIHDNSVVLGHGSRSAGELTVSVGRANIKRRIANLAPGQDASDAVTVAQLTQTNTTVGLLTGRVDGHDNEMLAFDTRVTAAENQVQTMAGYLQASGSNTASIVGSANNALAIGAGAQALHSNAVALGAGSFTTAGNSISVGSTGNERRVMHVADGTALTDAVNRGQLNATNNAVSVLDSRATGHDNAIAVLDGRVNNHDIDLSLHDGRIGAVEVLAQAREQHFKGTGSAAALIAAGSDNALALGAGAQVTHNDAVALGANSVSGGVHTVSIGRAESSPGAGDGITRRIVNVAEGTALTDAVTVSQLNQTNSNVATLVTRADGFDSSIGILTTRANDHDTDIGVLTGRADGHDGSLALHDGRIGAVEAQAQARELHFKGSGGAAAVIAAGAENALAIGAGAQASHNNSVALGADSVSGGVYTVSVGRAANGSDPAITRRIVNVAEGTALSDAVTVSQLNQTNAGVTTLGTRVDAHDVSLGVHDARIGVVETLAQETGQYVRGSGSASASISSGTDRALAIGAGAQALHENSVALGAGAFTSAKDSVSVGSTGSERRIMHVAEGTLATDAVNMAQLTQTNNNLSVLGSRVDGHDGDIGGLVTRADGVDADIIALGGRADGFDVEIAAHDTRLGQVETLAQGTGQYYRGSGSAVAAIASGADNALAIGAGALVTHDNAVALGAGSISGGINTVSVGHSGVGGQRRIVNVAPGDLPTDAVNKAQLDAVVSSGNADVGALSVRVDGHDAEILAHDTRLGAVETLAQSSGQYVRGSGSGGAAVNAGTDNALAIGAGALATHDNSVALGANSASGGEGTVSIGNAGNERRLVNVKAGELPTDAVNMGQLTQTNNDLGVLTTRVDGFDANIVTLTNRADGVDVSIGGLTGRVDQHDADIAAHQSWIGQVEILAQNGGQYVKSSGGVAASVVSGVNDALAIGAGAQVTHENSVALGANSSSGGVKTVSVGSAGNERRIVNVEAGSGATDAVNMSQLTQTNNALGALALRADGIDGSITTLTTRADGVDISVADLNTRADNLDNDLAAHNTWIGQVESMAQTTGQYVQGRGNGAAFIGPGVDDALAIGAGALVTHDNAVALGAGSMTSAINSVSVGSAGNERRVMHVAAGVDGTDAVNKAQLDAVEILANNGGAASNHFKATNPAQGTALAQASGINSTAAGAGAQANVHDASAFGAGAVAGFEHSLALGAGSITPAAYTVSVGRAESSPGAGDGITRRIVHVAAGYDPNDAANVGQLTALGDWVSANEAQINDNIAKLVINEARIENNLNQIVANNNLIGANSDEIDNNKVLITSNASDIGNNRARLDATEQYFQANGSGSATIAAGVIDSVVLGAGARAEHNNAVALGAGSISGGAWTVSIGNANNQRRLVNVAAGLDPTDAVNKAQLDAAVTSGGADVSALTARVEVNENDITSLNGRVGTVETLAQGTDQYYKGRGTGAAVIGGGVDNALAAGNGAVVSASNSVALGTGANVAHANAIALGAYSVTDDANTVSVGDVGNGVTRRITSVAAAIDDNDAVTLAQMKDELGKIGGGNADTPYFKANASVDADASGVNSVAAGSAAIASNAGAAVFGANSVASGMNALALGMGTQASHQNSIALGAGSRTYAANTVSVGSVGGERRIMNVARGEALTDAVNVGQLNDAIAGVGNGGGGGGGGGGGNASIAQFKASGSAVAVVGSGAANATAVGSGANASHDNAVALGAGSTTSIDNSVSVGSAGAERAITHVADGREGSTDAANMRNLAAVETRATGYVDNAIANIGEKVIESVINNNTFSDYVDSAYDRSVAYTEQVFNEFKADYEFFQDGVDRRFRQMDRKLDRIGAMSTAMVQMASSAGMAGHNRIGAGVGYQGGEAALAVGYQRVSPNRKVNLSLGGAFSGSSSSVGIGAGYSW